MKTILTIAAGIVLQTQVYGQLINYTDEGKVKLLAEKTSILVTGVDTKLTSDNQVAGLIAAAGTILPPVIDLVVSNVKEKTKKNALAYKGEYKGFVSGENFYKNNDYASLPMLTITRMIKTTDGLDKTAVEIELVPELSLDKTAFRYYVKDNCLYNYSVAKTKRNYDYIDLSLEIKFKSITINRDEYKINDLRTTTILIPMIHVNQTSQLSTRIYSGWIPLPPRSTAKNVQVEPVREEKTTVKTNNAGIKETIKEEVTVSKSTSEDYEKLADNTGMYEIEITAIETNPFKIKAENKEALVESSSESTTAIFKAMVESLIKEKEDKEEANE